MLNQYLVLSSFKMVKTAIDPKLIVRNSAVRAAIPILPMPLATLCFVLNLLVPGFGKLPSYFLSTKVVWKSGIRPGIDLTAAIGILSYVAYMCVQ